MGSGRRTRRGRGGSRARRGGNATGARPYDHQAAAGVRFDDAEDPVAAAIALAQAALDAGARHHADDLAVELAMLCAAPQERRAVVTTVVDSLTRATTAAWASGWQPADVQRMVARQHGPHAQSLLVDVVAHELARYAAATIDPQWHAQLRELGAKVWWDSSQTYLEARRARDSDWVIVLTSALYVLHTLTRLPRLERLTAIPGEAVQSGAARGDGVTTDTLVDERILTRVRMLLAKAESTNFEAEAETFTAGAQALMARHSIDAALLAAGGAHGGTAPRGRRLGIDSPYEAPKASLLDAVARANRCSMVWSKELGMCTIVGFDADLDAVELLFTSLLVQATKAVNSAGKRTDAYGNSRTRTFRQSFLLAFAQRIGERLEQVAAQEVDEAVARAGETAGRELVPVLAARSEEVQRHVDELFPQLRSASLGTIRDAEGWHFGRSAADRADLGSGAALERPRAR